MIVKIRVRVPFATRQQADAVTVAPAEPASPPRLPFDFPLAFPNVETDQGEILLRLNQQLSAYETPAPVNVTVHEAAVTNLAPPDAPKN